MNFLNRNGGVVALIAIVIAIGGFYFPQIQAVVGGMTNLDGLTITPVDSGDGLVVGSNGSTVAELKVTTCTLTQTAVARFPVATSTVPFDCAVTGIASGDVIVGANFNVNGGGTSGPLLVTEAIASTTAGIAQIGIARPFGTGASVATSSFPQATTSFQIMYIDN